MSVYLLNLARHTEDSPHLPHIIIGHNIIPQCLYSTTDCMMMNLHGRKYVEELL